MSQRNHNYAEWTVVATATNSAANAIKAAKPNHRHYITGLSISCNGGTPAAVSATVESAATILDRIELPAAVFAPIVVNYVHALRCGINEAAEVNIPALGAAIQASAVIKGYTFRE